MSSGFANTVRFLIPRAILWAGLTGTAVAADDATQVTEGFINAPVAVVWSLFTTAEGYKTLGVAQAQVDLNVGGLIRGRPDANGTLGDAETIVHEILAYDPQRMLALRIREAPASATWRDAASGPWTVIYFTPSGADMTHVRIVGLGYGNDAQSQAMRKFFAESNRRTLDLAAKRYWPKCKLCVDESAAQDATQTAGN